HCMHMKCGFLNEDGSPKEEAIQEAEKFLWDPHLSRSKLYLISVSDFEFHHIPIKAWKFLTNHCETEELWIEKTTVDIAALNSTDLCNITVLSLIDVGLAEVPCLYNLAGLKSLCWSDKQTEHVSFQSYFDADTGTYRTMPNLTCLDLSRNPVSKIDARIKEVFPNLQTLVVQKEVVDMSLPLSDVKEKLKEAGIELVETDLVSQMDWMPVTD
ncbi:uncharacterized protein VICG_02105, partial [Vittaforma corneae ATCC 50505]